MRPGRVLHAVMLGGGIKVAAGAGKIRPGTDAFLMDMEGVLSGWQIFELHHNPHPLGRLGQGGFPHLLPLGIDQRRFGRGGRALAAAEYQSQRQPQS